MGIYDAGPMPQFDAMDQAKKSLYAPSGPQQQADSWAHMPYSYQAGSQYGAGSLAPQGGGAQQQPQYPQATPPSTVSMFGGGGEGDDGAANAANAQALGQGVLAASQAATKGGGMGGMGMGKKKQGGGGMDLNAMGMGGAGAT